MESENSLEKIAESIYFERSGLYFKEVLSSYYNENYRSAVVMLWSIAICDIIYKLQQLVDLYEDASAKAILDEVSGIQEKDLKSTSWEVKLIDRVHKETYLLDPPEYENLRYLQQKRHLSAHPTLRSTRELYSPNKETVRALIRNTLEDLLIKPPFYTRKIVNVLLEDIAEASSVINTKEKVKRYVESRYLSRAKPEVEISIFKALWKLVFRSEDQNCAKNRKINFDVISLVSSRRYELILSAIEKERDYFSEISTKPLQQSFLVIYLAKNPEIFNLLNESAQLKIRHSIENTYIGRIFGWFGKNSLQNHYNDLIAWIQKDKSEVSVPLELTQDKLDLLLEISDTDEWQHMFCCLISTYFGASKSFNQADQRFQEVIEPYIHFFGKDSILHLLTQIENNGQIYFRGKACSDHVMIRDRLIQIYGSEEKLENFPHFSSSVSED